MHGVLTSDPDGGRFVARCSHASMRGRRTERVLVAASGDDAMRLRVAAGRRSRARRGPPGARCGHTNTDERARWRHAVARLDQARRRQARVAHRPARDRGRASGTSCCAARARSHRRRARSSPGSCWATPGGSRATSNRHTATPGCRTCSPSPGENVAFVLALVGPLLRRLPLAARTGVALAIILVFATMTRFEPSVLRASRWRRSRCSPPSPAGPRRACACSRTR